ncbi:MAG: helix-turn-helix transcriptional regulator [Thermoanaerobaculia bacterium]|nr:helix-turn-helix transcriptional regulator [Thermoanaerobaculia bacterium]
MSQKRQEELPSVFADVAEPVVRTLCLKLPPGHRIAEHAHAWHQLIYATDGVMTVATEMGTWVVPPRRAVWVPSSVAHSIEMTRTVRMRTIYIRPGAVETVPQRCAVVGVTPLLRELILRTVHLGCLLDEVPVHRRILELLCDELGDCGSVPLELHIPADPRARRVARQLLSDPASDIPLHELAAESGASSRTIQRLFRRETLTTFVRWRQRARLLEALRLLASGESVQDTAHRVGYTSTSAFIAMFRQELGVTPRRCFQDGIGQVGQPLAIDSSSVGSG